LGASNGRPALAAPPFFFEDTTLVTRSAPLTRSELFRLLDELGIATTTLDHPAVFTVEESESLERAIPGGHTKNLFLKDAKGALFLVVAGSRTPVDLKALARRLGAARFSFGRADLLHETLGVTPGSVTAFALANDRQRRVKAVLDQALLQHEIINCHPLENTATTSIRREDLETFLRATGHEPAIVDLTAASEPSLPI
jgi:Ala-tRNA(Pro) deacylase